MYFHIAHSGSHDFGSSTYEGFLHPIIGWDHLVTMIAIGLISSAMSNRHMYFLPISFVLAVIGGSVIGLQGWGIAYVELWVALSLVFLGFALVIVEFPKPLLVYLSVALFGLAHGNAHGGEVPSAAQPQYYVLGFVLASVLAHIAGIVVHKVSCHFSYRSYFETGVGLLLLAVGNGLMLKNGLS